MQHNGPATVRQLQFAILDALCTAATRLQSGLQLVRQTEQFLLRTTQCLNKGIRLLNIDNLNLTDQYRLGRPDMKATGFPDQFCSAADASDDRRFLNHHWYDVVFVIDQEIRCDGEWQSEYTDDVFNHFVGHIHRQQTTVTQQRLGIIRRNHATLRQHPDAVSVAQAIKVGKSRITQ